MGRCVSTWTSSRGREMKLRKPKRHWFQAKDGTYYRNCPLIRDEQKACPWWRWRTWEALTAEWEHAFRIGLIRKDRLSRGDVLSTPAPFREVYPDRPGLWFLDDPDWRFQQWSGPA